LAEVAEARDEKVADREFELRLTVVRARAHMVLVECDASMKLIRRAHANYQDLLLERPEEAIALRICEAAVLWQLSRAEEAVEKLLVIRSELLSRPDSYWMAWCCYQLSAAESVRGNVPQSRRYLLETLVSARRSASTWLEALALTLVSRNERVACRWSASIEAAEDALTIAEENGYYFAVGDALQSLGTSAWKKGRTVEALDLAEKTLSSAQRHPRVRNIAHAQLLKGVILIHLGEYSFAREIIEAAAADEAGNHSGRHHLLATEFLGDIHLEQEDAAPALARFDEVYPKAMALVPKGDIVAELLRRRAECYLLLGRANEAYDEAKRGIDHCRELGDRYEEAATYRVMALAAAASNRPGEAKKHFDQGFAYYEDIETPFEWGKLWMSYGDWLCGPHAAEYADPKGAMEAYHAAEDQFEGMGAAAKLAMVRTRIARLEGAVPDLLRDAQSATPNSNQTLAPPARRRSRAEAETDRRSQWASDTFELITRNRIVLELLEDVAKLSQSNAAILVLGESGTGKELVAGGIHRLSARKGRFTPLNMALVAREMFESELFGHLAGSFTGAMRDKPGLFEVSDNGTVFLDEIAEMPVELQSRLLRFLETGESRRIGATQATRVNTRLIAATNRDRAALERGEGFRTDLYYRLAHAVVVLPPLRQRGDDVELLLDHFFELYSREEKKHVRIARGVRERLSAYSWPGNIRELRTMVRRLVLLTADGGEIRESQLQLTDTDVPTTLTQELERAERGRIAIALDQHRGSRTEAAKALGMKRTTLLNKMSRYGLR
jgi:DNA-binding NtrC family response regulator